MIWTKYGASLGDERIIFLEGKRTWVENVAFTDAPFVHESLLNNEERDLIHKAWENR